MCARLCLFALVAIVLIVESSAHLPRAVRQRSGSAYLNAQRPLWVLEDQVPQHDMPRITYARPTESPKPRYYDNYRAPSRWDDVFQTPQRVQLPSHYIWTRAQNRSRAASPSGGQRRHIRRDQTPLAMPIFDNPPGSESSGYAPIFIYNGPKGELIFNTMLSARRYPMQEPVPGQTLYPPTAPIFRPKPIVERFHVEGRPQPVNLTLIPFYAHEAIDPRTLHYNVESPAALVQSTEEPPTPTVLYAAPAEQPTTEEPTTSAAPRPKKRRTKKAKQYSVYRSPHDVQWQPPAAEELQLIATPTTTPFPLALASPLQNHRYAYDVDAGGATTPQPQSPTNNFRLTYKDDEDQFQIVYIDESLEKPITERPKRLSSRYAMSNQYYAFPVFTLGKLLNPEPTEGTTAARLGERPPTTSNSINGNAESEADTSTWFILNSRYKGRHNRNGKFRLSSKYVQNPAPNTVTSTPESH